MPRYIHFPIHKFDVENPNSRKSTSLYSLTFCFPFLLTISGEIQESSTLGFFGLFQTSLQNLSLFFYLLSVGVSIFIRNINKIPPLKFKSYFQTRVIWGECVCVCVQVKMSFWRFPIICFPILIWGSKCTSCVSLWILPFPLVLLQQTRFSLVLDICKFPLEFCTTSWDFTLILILFLLKKWALFWLVILGLLFTVPNWDKTEKEKKLCI